MRGLAAMSVLMAAAAAASGPTRGPELIAAGNFSGGTVTNGSGTAVATLNGDGSLTLTGGSSTSLHYWSLDLGVLCEPGSTYEIIVPGVNSGGGAQTITLGGTGAGTLNAFTGTLTRQIVAGSSGTLLQFYPGSTMNSSGRTEAWGPSLSLKKVLA